MKTSHSKYYGLKVLLTILPFLLITQFPAHAVTGDVKDQEIWGNGTLRWVGQTTMRVGGASSASDGAAFYIFALPALPSGETVSSANLSFTLASIVNTPTGNVDLHGLSYRATAGATAADYYQGAFSGDSSAVPIQDNILTLSSSSGRVTSNATGSLNLANFLNQQYASGAQAGDYRRASAQYRCGQRK